jgi:DNA-binding CsgD family transcriptional regulator/PAS domain-containing protein
MHDDEKLSQLIGSVYDAALDPTLWIGVLEEAAGFVGGPAASLYSRDIVRKTGNVVYQSGLDARQVQLYMEKYIKLDPTAIGYFMAEIEEPVSAADVMLYDEFIETRFYKEWVRPQGLVDSAHAMLEKSGTGAAAFVVFRHQRDGLVDDEARRRMRLVVPHIRRAALVGKALDLKKAEAATLADAFEEMSAGIFFVDATGRILHANTAGHAILSEAEILRAARGQLAARDPETDRTLAETFATAANGDSAIGVKGIALPLTAADGERYVCHVLPLTSGARRGAGRNCAAVAALFVHKATLAAPCLPEAIAKAYGLTPSELRVLLAIVEVGGVPEVAEALGVSTETVKTHLGRIYSKTGARRQVDLAKFVVGFTNPLLG